MWPATDLIKLVATMASFLTDSHEFYRSDAQEYTVFQRDRS